MNGMNSCAITARLDRLDLLGARADETQAPASTGEDHIARLEQGTAIAPHFTAWRFAEALIAAEDLALFASAYPEMAIIDSDRGIAPDREPESAIEEIVRRALATSGPVNIEQLSMRLQLPINNVTISLATLKAGGCDFSRLPHHARARLFTMPLPIIRSNGVIATSLSAFIARPWDACAPKSNRAAIRNSRHSVLDGSISATAIYPAGVDGVAHRDGSIGRSRLYAHAMGDGNSASAHSRATGPNILISRASAGRYDGWRFRPVMAPKLNHHRFRSASRLYRGRRRFLFIQRWRLLKPLVRMQKARPGSQGAASGRRAISRPGGRSRGAFRARHPDNLMAACRTRCRFQR